MNRNKRIKFIKRLHCGFHTFTIKTEWIDYDRAAYDPIVKSCSLKKVRGQDKTEFVLVLNPNRRADGEIIESYGQLESVLDDFRKNTSCADIKITRADFCFNSDGDRDFEMYQKLTKLLICCVAQKDGIKNSYLSKDLWTENNLSISTKNDYFELENYDKNAESGGKSETKNRIEIRSKRMKGDLETEFTVKWVERLRAAIEFFPEVQRHYNEVLMEKWAADQQRPTKQRQYTSVTNFILAKRDCIFSRRQLIDLLEKMGVNNPENAAHNFKSRHGIEFYSRTDLVEIVKGFNSHIKRYFDKNIIKQNVA